MKCTNCGYSTTRVTNSRNTKDNQQVWRRRKCTSCAMIFTTYEAIDPRHIEIRTKSQREAFDRAKLFGSIYRALDGNTSATDSYHLTESVETKILNEDQSIVSSERLFMIVRDTLKQYDSSAYLRYISFYPDYIKDSDNY